MMTSHDLRLVVGDGRARIFAEPEQIVTARTSCEVPSFLRSADEALAAGYTIAGFLSYEFGYACVGITNPYEARLATPLAVLGFYAPAPMPPPQTPMPYSARDMRPRARVQRAAYRAALRAIADDLHAGNVYQVNYTVPFDIECADDPYALYRDLETAGNAPYAMYLEYADTAIASLSPEVFLRCEGDMLTTKPMKGTATLERIGDLASAKNRAEHVMIVDLLRNDLARVCSAVDVERLFDIERYPTFATMTSTIVGRRKADAGFAQVIEALFPCGSVTGAPKRAAMERIGRLETYPRGAYCGSIGYLTPDWRGIWNVAIRTLQFDRRDGGSGRLDLGGGIVADSIAEDEWAEIGVKARFFSRYGEIGAPRPG